MEKKEQEELLKSLKDLDHAMGRLKSFAKFMNRKAASPSAEDLKADRSMYKRFSKEYEPFLYWMTDQGWQYYRNAEEYNYYTKTNFEKLFPISKASEDLVQSIVDDMDEVKDRFEERGFDSHFLISFNGKAQQEFNPKTYKNDVYKFLGVGEKKNSSYFLAEGERGYGGDSRTIYNPQKYFVARIEFIII